MQYQRFLGFMVWFWLFFLVLIIIKFSDKEKKSSPEERLNASDLNRIIMANGSCITNPSDSIYLIASWGIWQDGYLEIMGCLNGLAMRYNYKPFRVIGGTTDEKSKVDELLQIQGTSLHFTALYKSNALTDYLYYLDQPNNANPDFAGDYPVFLLIKRGKILYYARGKHLKNVNEIAIILNKAFSKSVQK